MNRYFGSLICLSVLLALPAAGSTVLIYVSNQDGSSVDVIDPSTNKIVQRIEGIAQPDGVAFSLDGSRAYIPDQADKVLDVVETDTGKIIKKVPLSGVPNLPAMTMDGKRLLVSIAISSSKGGGGVDVIDTATLEKIKTIPLHSVHDMYVTADGKYAIAGSSADKIMSVIDLQTEQVVWNLTFEKQGPRPSVLTSAIESGRDGSASRIFVEMAGLNGFAVVDFATHKEVARVELPEAPYGYLIQPTHGTGITPDGKSLWVCSRGSNNVFVYSLPELKLVGHIHMPELEKPGRFGPSADPHWITFTPDSKTAYVALAALESVSAIDVRSLKEVARIPVGENPRHIATGVLPGSFVGTQPLDASGETPSASLTARWIAQLPEGKPKSIIVAKCQSCHSLLRIVSSHRAKSEWEDVVTRMTQQGAPLTPDEVPLLVDYLSTHFGLVSSDSTAGSDDGPSK